MSNYDVIQKHVTEFKERSVLRNIFWVDSSNWYSCGMAERTKWTQENLIKHRSEILDLDD